MAIVSKTGAGVVIDKALSYTSRGNKFVYHPEQIGNFLEGKGNSIISAHVAPTNACNLNCSYCNQENRLKGAFLPFETIQNFVTALKERGLKAVIVTGGGEPTLYPQFNKLVNWLGEQDLKTALITNGTNNRCGREMVDTWDNFSWIRVSLNFRKDGKLREVKLPETVGGKVGMSLVYKNQSEDMFREVADVADRYDARYVRILPDCCTSEEQIIRERDFLKNLVAKLGLKRFFVQDKVPAPAVLRECHQSRLRPFLLPDGTVAPCDCFMLNKDKNGEFYKTLPEHFNLATDKDNPASYVRYLDREVEARFNPLEDCNGCGFTENNQILEDLVKLHEQYPEEPAQKLFERIGQFPQENVKDREFV